jgi:hypothetical protein
MMVRRRALCRARRTGYVARMTLAPRLIALLGLACTLSANAAGPRPDAFREIPAERSFSGRLFAKPRTTVTRDQVQQLVRDAGASIRSDLPQIGVLVIDTPWGPATPGTAERAVAAQLMASGAFAYVEPDWLVFPTGVPNDTYFPNQWHHDIMESASAWDMTTGSNEVVIGVVDTGVNPHSDLGARVPGYNAYTDTAEVDGGLVTDSQGHGTHVAGCAAALGNNANGVSGMGWNFRILPVRATIDNIGSAYEDDLIEGVLWAANHGATVVNCSFSGIGGQVHEDAGAALHAMNVSLCWSAGNSAENWWSWDLPSVMVIGASDDYDDRASFSCFGRGVTVFAPGVAILSTVMNGSYEAWNGTSMASPVAAGALGLIRSVNASITAEQSEHILKFSCDTWGGSRETELWGYGRINLRSAIARALQIGTPLAPLANDDHFDVMEGSASTLEMDVLSNDDDPNAEPLAIASCDASTSMGDALTVLPGGGPGGRDAVRITFAPDAAPGVRTFHYMARDTDTSTDSATVRVDLQRALPATQIGGVIPGLTISYYDIGSASELPDFAAMTPYASEVVPTVDFPWSQGPFAGSGRVAQVGTQLEGFAVTDQRRMHTLYIESDGPAKLWVDDVLVVDNPGTDMQYRTFGSVALEAGMHAIRVAYANPDGASWLTVGFVGDSIGAMPSPSLRTRCTDACAAVIPWGDDSYGQVALTRGMMMVDGGYQFSIALDAAGMVHCFGINSWGQRDVPADLGTVSSVAAGYFHSIALLPGGSVRAWGSNGYGQCNVPSNLGPVVSVSGGRRHTLAVLADGSVRAWGWNAYGQCAVPGTVSNAMQVTGGEANSLARLANGDIVAWGAGQSYDDAYPHYGQGTVPADVHDFVDMDSGGYHTIALRADGTAMAWGLAEVGLDGVPPEVVDAVDVAAGEFHSLALLRTGQVIAWGDDWAGQSRVPADAGPASWIAAGGAFSFSFRSDATPCRSDLDGNDLVDFGDIAFLLLDFGSVGPQAADLDGSELVDFGDAALLMLDFGPCP